MIPPVKAVLLGAAALLAAVCVAQAPRPVQLRFMVGDSKETREVMRKLIDEYERRNPAVKINLEQVAEERERKLLIQYASRTAPDLFATSINAYRQFAYRNVFITVDELKAKYGMTYDMARVYPNVAKMVQLDGKTWALPSSVNSTMLVFYNRRHFREAGIPEPDGTWTYDTKIRPELREKDFVWVMDRLTIKGRASERRWGFATAWPQLFANSLVATSGIRLWDNDERPSRITLTTPLMVDVMQFAADCVQKKGWMPAFSEVQQAMGSSMYNEFVRGRISMYQSGPWEIIRLREDGPKQNLDWEATTFPRFAGRPLEALGEGNAVAVIRSTRHPKEAWDFAQYMAGEETQTALARAGQNQPAFRDLALKPGVWLAGPDEPERARPRNLKVTDTLAMSVVPRITPEYFDPVRNSIEGTFFGILSENRPAKEALERMQAEGSQRLAAQLRRLESSPFPWVPSLAIAAVCLAALFFWVYGDRSGPKQTPREKRASRNAHFFLVPWFVGLSLTLGPMIYSLMMSFSDSDIIRQPGWVGFRNYADALTGLDPLFYRSLQVTAIYTVFSIPLGLAASLGLALLLNIKVNGIPFFRAMYYIPSLASAVAMSLVWMRIFHPENGILNRLLYGEDGKGMFGLGLWLSEVLGSPGQQVNWLMNENTVLPSFIVMGLWGAGGGTIIFLAGLQNISTQYYEASKIDGASQFKQFRSITLPLLSPTIFFSLVTGVIGSFQVFTQAFVMTQGGPNSATMFYMLNLYNEAFRNLRMGYASALAWILFVIILILTVIQLRTASKWVFYEGEAK